MLDSGRAARAERVRGLLIDEVRRFSRARLQEAMVAYHEAVASFHAEPPSLPADPAARRALLLDVLNRFPRAAAHVALTVQHRDFKSMSDNDIESCLKQLQHLGVSGEKHS